MKIVVKFGGSSLALSLIHISQLRGRLKGRCIRGDGGVGGSDRL